MLEINILEINIGSRHPLPLPLKPVVRLGIPESETEREENRGFLGLLYQRLNLLERETKAVRKREKDEAVEGEERTRREKEKAVEGKGGMKRSRVLSLADRRRGLCCIPSPKLLVEVAVEAVEAVEVAVACKSCCCCCCRCCC